jgi:hypothetical protein
LFAGTVIVNDEEFVALIKSLESARAKVKELAFVTTSVTVGTGKDWGSQVDVEELYTSIFLSVTPEVLISEISDAEILFLTASIALWFVKYRLVVLSDIIPVFAVEATQLAVPLL